MTFTASWWPWGAESQLMLNAHMFSCGKTKEAPALVRAATIRALKDIEKEAAARRGTASIIKVPLVISRVFWSRCYSPGKYMTKIVGEDVDGVKVCIKVFTGTSTASGDAIAGRIMEKATEHRCGLRAVPCHTRVVAVARVSLHAHLYLPALSS